MKPELNPTQAIYPPEGPKPKVCVTTTLQLLNNHGQPALNVNVNAIHDYNFDFPS